MGGQKSKKNSVLTKFEVLALFIYSLKSGLIFLVVYTYIWELMQKKQNRSSKYGLDFGLFPKYTPKNGIF